MNRQQRRATARRKDTTGSTAARVDESSVLLSLGIRLADCPRPRPHTGQCWVRTRGTRMRFDLARSLNCSWAAPHRLFELIARAIRINDQNSTYFCQHGDAFAQLGRLESAIRSYDQAIRLRPDYAEAHTNRGDALAALGKHEAAVTSYDAATEAEPDYAEAWCNRGNCLRNSAVSTRQLPATIARSDCASTSLRPGVIAASHYSTSSVTKKLSQVRSVPSRCGLRWPRPGTVAAVPWPRRATGGGHGGYDRALAVQPDHAETWSSRGVALFERKRPTDAVVCYDRAIKLKPDLAEAWVPTEATHCKCLGGLPMHWEATIKPSRCGPGYPEVLSERVHLRYLTCDWRNRAADDAVTHRSGAPEPDSGTIRPAGHVGRADGSIALCSSVESAISSGTRAARSITLAGATAASHSGLSVGDFCQHPLAYLMADVLEQHDRSRFKVVCYSLWSDDGSASTSPARGRV